MKNIAKIDSEMELDEASGREQEQYLTFRLGEETFAMGILSVKEILEYRGVTTVPMMPECVRGVINLRGRVVPVIDLSLRFGRDTTLPGRRTCIVIAEIDGEGGAQDVGVIVDAVNQVIEIPRGDIEPAPSFGAKLRGDFLAGMGKLDGQFVAILNIGNVLSVDEISALAGAGGLATRLPAGEVAASPGT
ncbi:MAG: purine-binding chemotaxis protein CheW [Gammaproteobacteria bacterium]|nr:purine-binding chemotaxis protein CheW [Gammaproteobacteria bacterium]MBI5614948.1 purine-binding chemotaxis protein CheW [Gammaproteobacteria bacterium]